MMKRMKIIAAALALFMLALAFTACGTKTKTAVMTIEGYGDITIELDYGNAPKTAAHFEKLAKEGLLDGTDFIRMQEGFVLQGGANSKSTETIKGEFSSNGVNNKLEHKTGVISMARSNDPNSASTQFFIVLSDAAQPSLDGNYAAFGKITEGWDVIEKICSDIKENGGYLDDPRYRDMGFLKEENYIKIESVKMVG